MSPLVRYCFAGLCALCSVWGFVVWGSVPAEAGSTVELVGLATLRAGLAQFYAAILLAVAAGLSLTTSTALQLHRARFVLAWFLVIATLVVVVGEAESAYASAYASARYAQYTDVESIVARVHALQIGGVAALLVSLGTMFVSVVVTEERRRTTGGVQPVNPGGRPSVEVVVHRLGQLPETHIVVPPERVVVDLPPAEVVVRRGNPDEGVPVRTDGSATATAPAANAAPAPAAASATDAKADAASATNGAGDAAPGPQSPPTA